MVIVILKIPATRSLSKIISLRVRYMLWPEVVRKTTACFAVVGFSGSCLFYVELCQRKLSLALLKSNITVKCKHK